jgi:hypothetical protein
LKLAVGFAAVFVVIALEKCDPVNSSVLISGDPCERNRMLV